MSQPTVSTDDRLYREDTLDAYQRGVERAIQVMHARLGESLTVDDLADAALMSRYHFIRVFTKITSVSPARFLAAVRMQEAKRLLLKTDRSVTDICFDVGYNSLGTFSRLFTESVGFSPRSFKSLSRTTHKISMLSFSRFLPQDRQSNRPTLKGVVTSQWPLTIACVALFATSLPRGHPVECACLVNTNQFSFTRRAPTGSRIFAVGFSEPVTIEDALFFRKGQGLVASADPCRTSPLQVELPMHPQSLLQPPIVFAFPLVIASFLPATQMSTIEESSSMPNVYASN